jgi:hypothetical protein
MKKIRLYDPHPGFAGALAPIPTKIRLAAEAFDGKTVSIDHMVESLQSVSDEVNGSVAIHEEYKYISFRSGPHFYRLLRFEYVEGKQ